MAMSDASALVFNEVVEIAALFPRDGAVPAKIRMKLAYGLAFVEYSLDEDYPYRVDNS